MCTDQSFQPALNGSWPGFVAPLHSLSELDIAGFVVGLASLKGAWSAERFEDCYGAVSLLLAPQNADHDPLSFSVDRDATGLRMTAWRGDTHGLMGTFARPQDALSFVWKLVEAEHISVSTSEPETFRRAYQLIAQASAASPH